jgi:hypothetical protein
MPCVEWAVAPGITITCVAQPGSGRGKTPALRIRTHAGAVQTIQVESGAARVVVWKSDAVRVYTRIV